MGKTMKKTLCTLLVVVMCLTSAPLSGFVGIELPDFSEWFGSKASAANTLGATGQCGSSVYWSYDNTIGELTISGTGYMFNFDEYKSPFYSSDVKTVIIETGINNIGDYAFQHCKSLTNISIGNSITTIGKYAFNNCTNLNELIIPDSVVHIENNAFEDCNAVKNITMGKNVDFIGNSAFADCWRLKSINIPNSVKTIGENAFKNCFDLLSINIPTNITTIKKDTFYHCRSIKSIIIPSSVNTIEEFAFCGCSDLTNIEIPNSVKTIGKAAFSNCESLSSISLSNSITKIENNTFSLCYSLKNIELPNGIIAIGDYAFQYCENLISINIPNSVTTIGDSAFYFCQKLESINIPDSVVEVGELAFASCYNLKSVNIGNNVEYIRDYTFNSCQALENVTIGNSVKIIQSHAFDNCKKLTNIVVPDSVTTIGGYAFYECESLESVIIGDNVTSIGDYAFYRCGISSLLIGNSVDNIGLYAFYGSSLSNIYIPKSVKTISNAFSLCYNLSYITVDENNTVYSSDSRGVLFNKDKTQLIQYPVNSENEHYTIPDTVINIKDSAFRGCNNITSITIPNSISNIGRNAFYECDYISDVYFKGSETEWHKTHIQAYNESLTNATFHYNSTGPDDINAPDKSSLTINQNPIILDAEDTLEHIVTAVYCDKKGNNVLDADIKWTISDSSIISVLDIQNGYGSNVTFKAKNIGSTKLTARYMDKKAECYIFVKEIEPQLSIDVKNLVQNEDTFTFDVVCSNWYGVDCSSLTQEQREKATATNCYIDVTLPEGFSFYKDKDIKKSVFVINDGARLAPGDSKENSCTIYKIKKDAENKMVVTAKASNASTYKETVKLFVDGRDLTLEDRKIINDNVKVTVDVDRCYRKIQQRGGKIEYGEYNVANKILTNNEIPIQVTISNIIPSSYSEYEEYLKNNSEFDYNISNLTVSNIKGFKAVTIDKASTKKVLKAGESITLYGKAVLENNYLPMPENEQSRELSAKVEVHTSSGNKRTNNFSITVKNISYKPKVENVNSPAVAASALKNTPNSVCSVLCLSADLGLSVKQCEYISKLLAAELAIYSLPKKTLEEEISIKVLKKLFGYDEILSAGSGEFVVTIPVETDEGKIEIDLINTITGASWNGTGIGSFDSITYKAYRIEKNMLGKEKRAKEPFKTGVAGTGSVANVRNFFEAVSDYALGKIKSASKKVLGDVEEVEKLLFGECVLNVLSYAGYDSFFDFGWSVYVNECKKIAVKCPVDVYVYNSNDELCGTIINNTPTEICDEVELEVINDEKIIRLYGDGYYIKTIATAEGTMNITVSENDYNNGARRILDYTNLPLVVGTEYIQNYGEGFNVDSSVYNILYEDNSVQFADEEIILLTDNFCLHENTYLVGGSSATCTTTGKTQDEYCSDCSRLITKGSVIDKLGHSYSSVVTAPTCTNGGYTTYTCSCGDNYTETLAATGHVFSGSECINCDYDKADDCSCNCHKGGLSGFFFKIILFFQKIFRTNKECKCGIAHY